MWKKRINYYLFILILLSLSKNADSQEAYDLSTLIQRVLSENYQILLIKNQEQIADNNNSIGNAGFLPTLDAQLTKSASVNNVSNKYFTGVVRTSDAAKSNNLNAYVIMNWMVFDGFRMFARKDQLGLLQEMSAADTRFYIEQTVSDIADAWYQLIKENLLLENYKQTLDVSRFRLFLEKKKLDVGSGNGLLYNQALVDYNSDSLTLMAQNRLIKSIVIRINQIANLDPEFDLITTDKSISPGIVIQKDSLIDRALSSNREIKQVLIQEIIAETNIRLMKANYYPEINLYGQYSYNRLTNEVGTLQYGKNFGRQFGITVRFNLFNGLNDKREIVNSKILHESSSLEKENTIMQIKSTVLDNYYQYLSITQQLIVADHNSLIAQKSLEIAKIQYEKGAISGFDFRQTQLSLIRAQNTSSLLRYNLKSIEIELYRLTGEILEKLI